MQKYGYYGNKMVRMQFTATGGTYRKITVSESKTDGVFFIKATRGRCYCFIWKSNSTTGPSASKTDCSSVK